MKWLAGVLYAVLVLSTLAICYYAGAIGTTIWLEGFPERGGDGGFAAVIAAIFGILITGVFIFMTFRIDRGAITEARSEAHRTAKEEADLILEETRNQADEVLSEASEILGKAKKLVGMVDESAIKSNVETAMTDARQQMLNDVQRDARKFAINLVNSLGAVMSGALADAQPPVTKLHLRDLNEHDGQGQ